MRRMLRKRIGVKLFFLLTTMILLVMTPFCYMVFATFSQFDKSAADASRDELKTQMHSHLASMVREMAHGTDDFFSHVEAAATLMAAEVGEIYDHLEYYSGVPVLVATPVQSGPDQGSSGQQVFSDFLRGTAPAAEQIKELKALSQLDPMLKGVRKDIPESVSTYLITVSGVCRYLHYLEDGGETSSAGGTRPFEQAPLMETARSMSVHPEKFPRSVVWTRAHRSPVTGEPLVTVLAPVVDNDHRLRAAIGVDISITAWAKRSEAPADGEYGVAGDALFSFLVDDRGTFLHVPPRHFSLFGVEGNPGKTAGLDGFGLADSSIAALRNLRSTLLGATDHTAEIFVDGIPYVFSMHTLHRLNWHLILVARERRPSPSVTSAERALSGTIAVLVKKFVLHGLVILLVTMIVVYFAVDYFVGPLKRLSETALLVGRGNLRVRCEVDRDDELGMLSESFNNMVSQLEVMEKRKVMEARELELMVQERTRDLRNKNIVLREVIDELNVESERRRRAVEALRRSEEQIRVVMEASVAGHGIIQEQQIRYVNSMVSRIFGYSQEEMTSGELRVSDLVAPDQFERVRSLTPDHFRATAEKPFLLECCRKDGSAFDALVGVAMTSWNGRPAVVATVMDISDQKQKEEELLHSKTLLQDSLAEKEVLLREIYHRTKNNMLVIISMLHLQAMELEDEQVKTLFWETENRIRAMSLVHEKLYQSQSLTEIDLGQYLEEMVAALVRSMVIGDAVHVDMDCRHIPVSIDNIVPLGLAVNEIVTNSLKHAFSGGRKGCIFVRLSRDGAGRVEVVVGDDGPGLPPEVDPLKARSLGMQITASLITRQLRGTMEVESGNGVVYRIRFTEPLRPKRV